MFTSTLKTETEPRPAGSFPVTDETYAQLVRLSEKHGAAIPGAPSERMARKRIAQLQDIERG